MWRSNSPPAHVARNSRARGVECFAMARGWESKSVESQIEDAQERRERQRQQPIEPEEAARAQKRAGIELSRTRVARELAAATSEVRRAALRSALAHLDEELERLR